MGDGNKEDGNNREDHVVVQFQPRKRAPGKPENLLPVDPATRASEIIDGDDPVLLRRQVEQLSSVNQELQERLIESEAREKVSSAERQQLDEARINAAKEAIFDRIVDATERKQSILDALYHLVTELEKQFLTESREINEAQIHARIILTPVPNDDNTATVPNPIAVLFVKAMQNIDHATPIEQEQLKQLRKFLLFSSWICGDVNIPDSIRVLTDFEHNLLAIRPLENIADRIVSNTQIRKWDLRVKYFNGPMSMLISELGSHARLVFGSPHEEYYSTDMGYELLNRFIKAITSNLHQALDIDILKQRLKAKSIDYLTRLPNRDGFEPFAERSMESARKENTPVCLALLDVDNFKRVNDTYGHGAGDVVLKTLGSILQGSIKLDKDMAARWGGEEFVVIMPGAHIENAERAMAKALETLHSFTFYASTVSGINKQGIYREENEELRMAKKNGEIATFPVTFSAGIAEYLDDIPVDLAHFIAQADGRMYQAKHKGKAQVRSSQWVIELRVVDEEWKKIELVRSSL